MRVGVLGPLEAVTDDGAVVFQAAKERAVLTLLALRSGAATSSDELVDALWGEEPPPSARKAVQIYIANLRRRLPAGAIATSAGGYSLVGAEVDASTFERLLRDSRRLADNGNPEAAAAALTAALRLWRGPPLPDLTGQPPGLNEAVRLGELHALAEEDLADIGLAKGDHRVLIPILEAAVAAAPLRERRWAQLMLALYRSGRQADALRAYQRVRQLLADELGVTPGPVLQDLEHAVLSQDAALGPPSRLAGPRPAPIPVAANRFIGRETEAAALATALEQARLVTLVGPGGSGKTRLAVEVSNRSRHRYADGVFLASLAPGDSDAVAANVAAALDLEPEPDRPLAGTIVAFLNRRQVLIVLDNCEHVIAAAARLAETIVSSCPDVSILATSREALRGPSEQRFPVGPLPEVAAVELFVDRAAAVKGGWQVDQAEETLIEGICQRLDGLPLALEIIAARSEAFTLAELDAGLDEHRLGSIGHRASEARHRTMHAAIERSYQLLSDSERWLFRRLSVFAGGARYSEVAALGPSRNPNGGDPVIDAAGLVAKSLVARTAGGEPQAGSRLFLHETVRHFALEQLRDTGEEEAARHDHAAIFLGLAETEGPRLRGRDQLKALVRLDEEQDNTAAAINWALGENRAELASRFGRALWWYWFRAGRAAQGRVWIEAALRSASSDPDGEPRAAAGYLAWVTDDFAIAVDHAETVLASDRASPAAQALALGVVARVQGDREDYAAATAAAADSERRYEEIGDPWFVAWARRCRASAALFGGDPEAARLLTADAMVGFRAAGDEWAVAGCQDLLAGIARRRGAVSDALDLALESVGSHRRFGDSSGTRVALLHLAEVARQAGDTEAAKAAATESLSLSETHGYRLGALHAHLLLGQLAAGTGDRADAAAHGRKAAALADELEDRAAAADADALVSNGPQSG